MEDVRIWRGIKISYKFGVYYTVTMEKGNRLDRIPWLLFPLVLRWFYKYLRRRTTSTTGGNDYYVYSGPSPGRWVVTLETVVLRLVYLCLCSVNKWTHTTRKETHTKDNSLYVLLYYNFPLLNIIMYDLDNYIRKKYVMKRLISDEIRDYDLIYDLLVSI